VPVAELDIEKHEILQRIIDNATKRKLIDLLCSSGSLLTSADRCDEEWCPTDDYATGFHSVCGVSCEKRRYGTNGGLVPRHPI